MSIKASKTFATTLILALIIFVGVVLIGQNEHRPVTSPDARRLEPELRRIWYWLQHWDRYETLPRQATEYSHALYVHEDTVEACFYVDDEWHCLPFDEFMIRGAVNGLDTLIAGWGILGDRLAHGDTVAVDSSILGEGGADSLYAGRYLLKNSETDSDSFWVLTNGDTVHVDTSFMTDDEIPWEGLVDTTIWDMDKNIVYIFPTSDTSVTDTYIHSAMDSLSNLATEKSSWLAMLMNGIHRPDEGWNQPSYVTCVGQSDRAIVLNKKDDESWDDDDSGWTDWDDYIRLYSFTRLKGIVFEDNLGQASGRGGAYYVEAQSNTKEIVIEECEFYMPYFHRVMNLSGADSNVVVRNNFIGKRNYDSYKDGGRWDGQYADRAINLGDGHNIRVENNVFESWAKAIHYPNDTTKAGIEYNVNNNIFKRSLNAHYLAAATYNRQFDDTLWIKTYDNQYYNMHGVVFKPYWEDPLYIWISNEDRLSWPSNARVELYGRDFYKNAAGDSVDIKTIYERIYVSGVESSHIKNNTIEWEDLSSTLRGIIFGDSAESDMKLSCGMRFSMDSLGVNDDGYSTWQTRYHNIIFIERGGTDVDDDFYVHPWDSLGAGLGHCLYGTGASYQGMVANPDTISNDYLYPSDGFLLSFWLKIKDTQTGTSDDNWIISKGNGPGASSPDGEWGIEQDGDHDGAGDPYLYFWTSHDSVNFTTMRSDTETGKYITEDSTYFVAMWYDKVRSKMCFTFNPYDSVYSTGISGVYDNDNVVEIFGRYAGGNTWDETNGWIDEVLFFPGIYPDTSDGYALAKTLYDAGQDSVEWDSTTVAQYDSTNIADGGISLDDLAPYLQDRVAELIGGYGIDIEDDTVKVDTNEIATKSYVDNNTGGGGSASSEPSYYEVQIDSTEMDSQQTTITYYDGYGKIDSFFYVMHGGESLNVDLMGDSSRANSTVIKNMTLTNTTSGTTLTDIGGFPGFLWIRANNANSKPEELWARMWISPTTEFEIKYSPILFCALSDTLDWTGTYNISREANEGHQLVHFQADTAFIDSAMRTNDQNWLRVQDSDSIDWNKSWCFAGWVWLEYVGYRQMVRVRGADNSESAWWIGNRGQYTLGIQIINSEGDNTLFEKSSSLQPDAWRFVIVWWDADKDSVYAATQWPGYSWNSDYLEQWSYTDDFNDPATELHIGNNWQGYLDAVGMYRNIPKSEDGWQMAKDLFNSGDGYEPE